jgi:hypothetical protein
MRIYGLIAALVILVGAAIGLLARSGPSDASELPFQVSARAYNRLQAGVTPVTQLQGLGFDLSHATRLSYLAMVEQFLPAESSGFDALDPSVQDCLASRDRCSAYSFPLAGKGDVQVVVVIQSGRVAYKSVTDRVLASGTGQTAALE